MAISSPSVFKRSLKYVAGVPALNTLYSNTPPFVVKFVKVRLRCLTAEYGYAVGDVFDISNFVPAASGIGHAVAISGNTVKVMLSSVSILVKPLTGGSSVSITLANWSLEIESFG